MPALLLDPALSLAADVLDDLEKVRTANANRLRILTTPHDQPDEDGECRGFGLDESHPDVARLAAMVDTLARTEHDAVLQLQRQMRRHPLAPWAKARRGVGEKQAARLLAAVGDPYWNTLHDRPRTVSELWAYCGLHVTPQGTSARRQRGVPSNWSTGAKTRAYLVAVSCMKSVGSDYRQVYLDRRAHTAGTHPDWTDGHSHNDALRVLSKALLRDLWRESARVHGEVVAAA